MADGVRPAQPAADVPVTTSTPSSTSTPSLSSTPTSTSASPQPPSSPPPLPLTLRFPPPPPSPSVLRKSFSADSFSSAPGFRRNAQRMALPLPPLQTAIAAVAPVAGDDQGQPTKASNPFAHPRDIRFPLSGRSRGASVSTTASNTSNHSEGSDHDHDLGQSAAWPPPPPPSSSHKPSRHRFRSRPESSPGLVLPPKVATPDNLAQATDYFNLKAQLDQSEFSIAVVGRRRCGKTTAIEKGLKHYALGPPVVIPPRDHPTFTYVVRDGSIKPSDASTIPLHVFEVDAAVLEDPQSPGHFVWPRDAPALDAVIVCYDVTNPSSIDNAEALCRCFRDLKLPVIVFACKFDLDHHIDTRLVHARLKQLDVGIVEVTEFDRSQHQRKAKLGFQWLFRVITRGRYTPMDTSTNYNPASPDILVSPDSWPVSRASTATPTATGTPIDGGTRQPPQLQQPPQASQAPQNGPPSSSQPSTPRSPTSPTRSRSASDLGVVVNGDRDRDRSWELARDKSRSTADMAGRANGGNHGVGNGVGSDGPTSPVPVSVPPPPPPPLAMDSLPSVEEAAEDKGESREREIRPTSWATLDELLQRLLFYAISGDDPAFIAHFLLTYRRFASPRSVVLALQKRMRWLDQPSTDPLFACFAQMRICHLLELWIQDYPHDFAVGQASGALNALVRSIVSKTLLLHYGTDFLPFLEGRPLVDRDAAWAMKVDEAAGDENDDGYKPFEDGDDDDDDDRGGGGRIRGHGGPGGRSGGSDDTATATGIIVTAATAVSPKSPAPPTTPVPPTSRTSLAPSAPSAPTARERKSSLPLSARALIDPEMARNPPPATPEAEMSPKGVIRELQAIAAQLDRLDVDVVAQEITRIEVKLFAAIEPRHWLQHTLVPGLKDSENDPIARFLEVSYHLAEWVVSLILCHDRTRARVRQIEKFVEIAARLRHYNNYSALRAFVAAIHKVTLPGDELMETFKSKSAALFKTFQSWEVMLQSSRSHGTYRMALHSARGACIPALEVHLQDLIKAHAGNVDVHPDDETKIHWAKFNMMGKFIQTTADFQAKCQTSIEYQFRETRDHMLARQLLMRECKMDLETQKARMQLSFELGEDEKAPSAIKRLLDKWS